MLGDISTGAGNDLQRASAIARNMVMRYGMSDRLGSVVFDSGHDEVFIGRSMAQAKSYSEETADLIDQEVKAIIDKAYARCRDILTRQREQLELTAQYLLENETMDAADFELVFTDPDALREEDGSIKSRVEDVPSIRRQRSELTPEGRRVSPGDIDVPAPDEGKPEDKK